MRRTPPGHPAAALTCSLLAVALLTACSHERPRSSEPAFCASAVADFANVLQGAQSFTGAASDNGDLGTLRLLLEPKLTNDAPSTVNPAVATLRQAASDIANGDHSVLDRPELQEALKTINTWAQASCRDASG